MRVQLLYNDREWKSKGRYYDYKNIIEDLSLDVLFRTASREQVKQSKAVQSIVEADGFLEDTIGKVMMVPLRNKEELVYRQDIIKDFLSNEDFIKELYSFASDVMLEWEQLGKNLNDKNTDKTTKVNLVTEIHLLSLFLRKLDQLNKLVEKHKDSFQSVGLIDFEKHLHEDYSTDLKECLEEILESISFYVDEQDDEFVRTRRRTKKAYMVIQCGIANGLKLGDFKLEEIGTLGKKYKKHVRKKSFMEKCMGGFAPALTHLTKEDMLLADTVKLEYQVVHYLMAHCTPFMSQCKQFFEQLHFQSAFYRAVLNIKHRMERHHLPMGYPTVGEQNNLKFEDLKDLCMSIQQLTTPVGNESSICGKNLLIVTGANQGGKSTYLRSIGIAQIMMQAGMFVAANSYESGLFSSVFTHFTRREDSEMNSGRLDEELGRMSRIIDNIGETSLVLLNESFATTTEKEGSVIAYDIIKALTEHGVKVLTVTHLLSFAKKVYDEKNTTVEFLCAERKSDGSRTFKMIQHEPELTSFGLDLYESIIGG